MQTSGLKEQSTTTTLKKQQTTVSSKNTYVKGSAQKVQKKGVMNIHHTRTKSDNIYNRGSIAANNTPAHAAKNIGTS